MDTPDLFALTGLSQKCKSYAAIAALNRLCRVDSPGEHPDNMLGKRAPIVGVVSKKKRNAEDLESEMAIDGEAESNTVIMESDGYENSNDYTTTYSSSYADPSLLWECQCGCINSYKSLYCTRINCFEKRMMNLRDYEILHIIPEINALGWKCSCDIYNSPNRDVCSCNEMNPWICPGREYSFTQHERIGWWKCPNCEAMRSLTQTACSNVCLYARYYLFPFPIPENDLGRFWWCSNGHPTQIPRRDCQFCDEPFVDYNSNEYKYMLGMESRLLCNSNITVSGWQCPMCFQQNPRNAYACIWGCSFVNNNVWSMFVTPGTRLTLCQKCSKQNALFPCTKGPADKLVFCFACAVEMGPQRGELFTCSMCKPQCLFCKSETHCVAFYEKTQKETRVCFECHEKMSPFTLWGPCRETHEERCVAALHAVEGFSNTPGVEGLLSNIYTAERKLCEIALSLVAKDTPHCIVCSMELNPNSIRYNLGKCAECNSMELTACHTCSRHLSKVRRDGLPLCHLCKAEQSEEEFVYLEERSDSSMEV